MKKVKLDLSDLVEEYTRREIEEGKQREQYKQDVLSGKISPNLDPIQCWNISDRD